MDYKLVNKIVSQIKSQVRVAPEFALILGSGWGDVVELVENPTIINYSSIKGMPTCSVKGHLGNFVFGKVAGKNVCIMQGRFHYYEGKGIENVVLPIYILKQLGVAKLFVTNASGAVNKNYNVGDLVVISDHINNTGNNPLIGLSATDEYPIFVDMSEAYDSIMTSSLYSICKELNISVQKGVYMQNNGPCFETSAEVKMAQNLGADLVGMSTVYEVIVARYLKINCCGISCVSNMGTGLQNTGLSHNEVMENLSKTSEQRKNLIYKFLQKN